MDISVSSVLLSGRPSTNPDIVKNYNDVQSWYSIKLKPNEGEDIEELGSVSRAVPQAGVNTLVPAARVTGKVS